VPSTVTMLKLIHSFTMIVNGPTMSGKTIFVLKMIDNMEKMIKPSPERIMYCYKEYQADKFDSYASSGRVTFFKGLPANLDMFDGKRPTLLIIDDLMAQMNETLSELFTVGAHHKDISVVFLTQNMFPKNKHARTINLNTQYLVFYKNPRDITQFATLARQMYNSDYSFALEAFTDATENAHSYLLIDWKPQTEKEHRLRTGIFPGEQTYVYVDRKVYKPVGW
jgi:hypothetical protein